MTGFPSVEQWETLKRARNEGGGLKALGGRERQWYHAYDYGWRRVRLNDRAQTSPIDPQGEYFDEPDVLRAEAMWRERFTQPKPRYVRDETPPPGTSAEDAARFRAQWEELARLRPAAEAEKRAGIERGPALLAYGEAAFRMVRENVARWAEKQRPLPDQAAAIDELARELGVRGRPETEFEL
jgi:hypothetical protein